MWRREFPFGSEISLAVDTPFHDGGRSINLMIRHAILQNLPAPRTQQQPAQATPAHLFISSMIGHGCFWHHVANAQACRAGAMLGVLGARQEIHTYRYTYLDTHMCIYTYMRILRIYRICLNLHGICTCMIDILRSLESIERTAGWPGEITPRAGQGAGHRVNQGSSWGPWRAQARRWQVWMRGILVSGSAYGMSKLEGVETSYIRATVLAPSIFSATLSTSSC